MTKLGFYQKTALTAYKAVSIGLAVILCLFAFEEASAQNTSTQSRSQVPVSAPEKSNFSVGGYLYQNEPARSEKDPYTLFGASLDYEIEKSKTVDSSASLSLEGSHLWTEYKDKNATKLDALEMIYMRKNALIYKGSKLFYGGALALPANDLDKTAGFRFSIRGTIGLSIKLGSQVFVFDAEPTFYNYAYTTANAAGDEYNKRSSLLVRARAYSTLMEKLTWRNMVSLYDYENYSNKSFQQYSFSSMLAYAVQENFTLIAGITSGDRVITTNAILADDVTAYRAGLEWSY